MGKIAIIGLSGGSLFMKVDTFPRVGETIIAHDFTFEPGGKGYNQALACQRLGGESYFLSAIGSDYYGQACKELLEKERVSSQLIIKDLPTSLATILIDNKGNNQVIVYHGAKLDTSDLLSFEKIIKDASILLLQLEVPIEIIKKAIKIARQYHTYIILDPAPYQYLDNEIIESVDLLTPNEIEAQSLFDVPIDLIPKVIKNKNLKRMIITLGEKGALLYENDTFISIPPVKVNAIDTTGAGDVFNAALAVKISAKASLLQACQFAVAASALSVTKANVIQAIPTQAEVEKFIYER